MEDAISCEMRLAAHGIPCRIDNETACASFGMSMPAMPLVITVEEEDVEEALAILKARESRASSPRSTLPWVLVGVLLLLSVPTVLAGKVEAPANAVVAWFFVTIGLLAYVRGRHPSHRVPVRRIAIFFTYGAVAAIPGAALLQYALSQDIDSFRDVTWRLLWIGSAIEEVAKILGPLLILAFIPRLRNEPFEWFIAAVASAAGFAAIENTLFYCLMPPDAPIALFIMRSGTLVHLVCSGAIGYAIGRAHEADRFHPVMPFLAFTAAVIVHGGWNSLAMIEAWWALIAMSLGLLPVAWWGIRKATARTTPPAPASDPSDRPPTS